jgi:hypothetical protein
MIEQSMSARQCSVPAQRYFVRWCEPPQIVLARSVAASNRTHKCSFAEIQLLGYRLKDRVAYFVIRMQKNNGSWIALKRDL